MVNCTECQLKDTAINEQQKNVDDLSDRIHKLETSFRNIKFDLVDAKKRIQNLEQAAAWAGKAEEVPEPPPPHEEHQVEPPEQPAPQVEESQVRPASQADGLQERPAPPTEASPEQPAQQAGEQPVEHRQLRQRDVVGGSVANNPPSEHFPLAGKHYQPAEDECIITWLIDHDKIPNVREDDTWTEMALYGRKPVAVRKHFFKTILPDIKAGHQKHRMDAVQLKLFQQQRGA